MLWSLLLTGCGATRSVAEPPPMRAGRGPSLPLPEVTHESMALDGWPAEKPIPGSIRAWHYRPEMIEHLRATITAILENATLGRDVVTRLVVVVASRNGCFY